MPDEIIVRDSLPKTMVGKLSKKDLLAEVAVETGTPAPMTAAEG